MKISIKLMALFLSLCAVMLSACGSSGEDVTKPAGPILDVSDALNLAIDQFYINDGLSGEYAALGEFSVYLRDAATNEDVACSTNEDGMKRVAGIGVYYAGLGIPLREVDGKHPSTSARFKLIFVEQDGKGCPEIIGEDDLVVGESPEFSFDGLLDNIIWATNGTAAVKIRSLADEISSSLSMVPMRDIKLTIDKLYFVDDSGDEEANRYYLFVDKMEDGHSVYQCQIDDSYMQKIRYGNIIYSALNIDVPCFDPTDPAMTLKPVKVGLYVQRDEGPELVAETEVKALTELVGEKIPFIDDKGYVSFRGVDVDYFSAETMRLIDFTSLAISALNYTKTPSDNPQIEVEIVDPDWGFVIACAGEGEGLTGVETPEGHTGLDASFVAADPVQELFGWDGVIMRVIDRQDGYMCPSIRTTPNYTVLAESEVLNSHDLLIKAIKFRDGGGALGLEIRQDSAK